MKRVFMMDLAAWGIRRKDADDSDAWVIVTDYHDIGPVIAKLSQGDGFADLFDVRYMRSAGWVDDKPEPPGPTLVREGA